MIDPEIYAGIERGRAKAKGISIQDHALDLVKEAAAFVAERRWARGPQRGGHDADILLVQTTVEQTVALLQNDLSPADAKRLMADAVNYYHVLDLKLTVSGGKQ